MPDLLEKRSRGIITEILALLTVLVSVLLSVTVNAYAEGCFLNVSKLTLNPGGKSRLQVIMYDGAVEWYSKDENIATVDENGNVYAVAEGKTSIVAVAGETKLKCTINVVPVKSVRLCALGDALLHENILNSGKQSDGSYNYDMLFTHMRRTLKDFDVKIINQETIFINDSSKYAGYPSFGSPTALGDAIRNAGFNVITCATNHAYDRGIAGIKDTVEYWKQYEDDVLMTGIYTDRETYKKLSVRSYNGIKIAFLNYTELVNSGSKREDYNIRFLNEKQVIKDIASAGKKADFVIVLPHWGTEYEHTPSERQKRLAQQMADAGADLIIGCHPHVVQPMKIINTKDGRRVPCFYSLGNCFSNMFWFKCQLEGMADVTITKKNNMTKITECSYVPIVNHMRSDDQRFSVYRLEDYSKTLAAKHYMNYRIWMGIVTPERLENLFKSIGNDKW